MREDESSSTYRMIHRSISPAGVVGPTHTVATGFNYLGYFPAVLEFPSGVVMAFGAARTGDGYSNSHMEIAASSDGEMWSGPADTGVTDGPGESPSAMDGTVGPSNVSYVVWDGTLCICVHRYTGPVDDADHTNYNDVGGNNIHPSIGFDAATGKVWVVYLIFGGDNPGLYVREVSTADGEPAGPSTVLPGSFDVYQGGRLMPFQNGRVPMTQRDQGGVFVAYAHGYPDRNRVRVWRIGGDGFTTVGAGRGIGEVAIAADPEGRIWIVWDRNGRVNARRSNRAVTRWGKGVTMRFPKDTVDVSTIQADAQTDVLDVLVHSQQVGNSGFFHTQLEPGISFRASPRRFRGAENVEFKTKDAGAPLENSRITVAGRSCTTNARGVCSIQLGPYAQRKRLKAKATHPGYEPAKRVLRARPPA